MGRPNFRIGFGRDTVSSTRTGTAVHRVSLGPVICFEPPRVGPSPALSYVFSPMRTSPRAIIMFCIFPSSLTFSHSYSIALHVFRFQTLSISSGQFKNPITFNQIRVARSCCAAADSNYIGGPPACTPSNGSELMPKGVVAIAGYSARQTGRFKTITTVPRGGEGGAYTFSNLQFLQRNMLGIRQWLTCDDRSVNPL
jgi:hypothetical protein